MLEKLKPLTAICCAASVCAGLLYGCVHLSPIPVEGTWIITDATFSPVSAMDHSEAQQWYGKSYQYYNDLAKLDQQACQSPSYSTTTIDASEFSSLYKTTMEEVGINQRSLESVSVTCDGDDLLPGQLVLKLSETAAVTVWDGVFFHLERAAKPSAGGSL